MIFRINLVHVLHFPFSEQDINQDGYGDIVLGAPGVGDDEGAAYVVFGRSVFSYSYSLGNLTAENGVTLATSTVNGYAGCSVSGAGETCNSRLLDPL